MKKTRHIKHYSDDRNDALMVSVRCLYGMEGYGVYWAIMEILSASDGYSLPTEYEQIAKELSVTTELVRHIVEDHGLFVVSDGQFHSQRLSVEMGRKDRISEARREAGTIGMKSRWSKEQKKPVQAVKSEPTIPTSTQDEKKPQQAPKSRTKYTSDEVSLHTKCKELFAQYYKQYKGTDFYWNGRHMSAIVGILKQIRFHMPEDERDNKERLYSNFDAFIKLIFVNSDGWTKENISPSLISSRFNELYSQLKNNRNGNRQTTEGARKIADASQFADRI